MRSHVDVLLESEWVEPDSGSPRAPIQRVALLTEAFLPKVDGVSRSALLTTRYLQASGREVLIIAPRPAIAAVGPSRVVAVPALPLPAVPETRVTLPVPLMRTLRHFQPDIIHLFSPAALGAFGMLAAARLGVPCIANYQSDIPAYAQSYGWPGLRQMFTAALRFIHNGCTLTLAPSPSTLAELRAWGFKRLRSWERGVHLDRFNPAQRSPEWRAKLLAGRAPNRLIALYVGRLAHDKHIETLRALAVRPEIALTLIGEGSHRAALERHFAGTDALFMGPAYGADLASAYASADVFIFAGPEETFGQVVLEALASGLPAVVAARGGPKDLIRDGETGFICAVDDGAAFAERVAWLAVNPERRAAMGRSARESALMRTWPRVMAQLEGYYAEALTLQQRKARRGHSS